MKKLVMLATAAFFCATVPALAEHDGAAHDGDAPKHAKFMEKLDIDKDGVVSKAEFMTRQEERWVELDADKDGKATPEEFKAQKDAWVAKRKEVKDAEKAAGETAPAPVTETAPAAPTQTPAQ